ALGLPLAGAPARAQRALRRAPGRAPRLRDYTAPVIDRRRVPELWRRLDVTARDLPLGILVLVASALPGFQGNGTEFGGVPTRPADALAVVAAVLQSLPLAMRRRWPLV